MTAQLNLLAPLDDLCCTDDISAVDSQTHQHTNGCIECPACRATESDMRHNDPDSLRHLRFPDAATKWLSTMEPYLNKRTVRMYAHHIKSLGKFFHSLTPARIHIGNIRTYQAARRINEVDGEKRWQRPCGPSIINHEISLMQQVMKRAGCWKQLAPSYKALSLPAFTPKKTMTDEEEDRLFDIGAANSEFHLPLMVAYLSVNTTACGSELRNVKIEHISLDSDPPRLLIATETAKNGYRGRVIPLNETAEVAIRQCVARAKSLGSHLPRHYLFPKRITTGHWDPELPASPAWLTKRWTALREAAELPWLTPHCLRHMAITRMLEFGVPGETVRNIAGHVSETMMRHYSHGRIAASAKALEFIDPRHRKGPQSVKAERKRWQA